MWRKRLVGMLRAVQAQAPSAVMCGFCRVLLDRTKARCIRGVTACPACAGEMAAVMADDAAGIPPLRRALTAHADRPDRGKGA